MMARTATLVGSLVGGFLASVCCIVPLAFALLGLSGAAFALLFEPLRPYLLLGRPHRHELWRRVPGRQHIRDHGPILPGPPRRS